VISIEFENHSQEILMNVIDMALKNCAKLTDYNAVFFQPVWLLPIATRIAVDAALADLALADVRPEHKMKPAGFDRQYASPRILTRTARHNGAANVL
jgi:hypothetical protein